MSPTRLSLLLLLTLAFAGPSLAQQEATPAHLRELFQEDCESFATPEEQSQCEYRNTKRRKAHDRVVALQANRRQRQIDRTTVRVAFSSPGACPTKRQTRRGRAAHKKAGKRRNKKGSVVRLKVMARTADNWSYEPDWPIEVKIALVHVRTGKTHKRWKTTFSGTMTDQEVRLGPVRGFRAPARSGKYELRVTYGEKVMPPASFTVSPKFCKPRRQIAKRIQVAPAEEPILLVKNFQSSEPSDQGGAEELVASEKSALDYGGLFGFQVYPR